VKDAPLVARVSLLTVVVFVASVGCSAYRGTARTAEPARLAREGDWTMVENFPLVRQVDSDDCGGAALASVLRFWGHPVTPESVEKAVGGKNRRLRAGDMAAHARELGLRAYVFNGTMNDVVYELKQGRPIIVGLGKELATKKVLAHYEVVVGYEPQKRLVLLLDPGLGWQIDTFDGFNEEWARSGRVTLVTFLPAGEDQTAIGPARRLHHLGP
jgi:ABC-type bacteriocin/lantibiotic exporter with double-glycine peptidase domain